MSANPDRIPTVIPSSTMSGKKRSFTVAFKLEAVEYALQNSSEGAARKYNVDSKRIRDWRRQKNKLVELSQQHIERKRLKGGGRHVFCERMEELLAAWVRENRNNKVHVSRKIIQQEAQRLHHEIEGVTGQKFTASRGWLQRFLERNGFVKTKTTESPKDPCKIISKLVQHVINVRQMVLKNNYGAGNIVVMDEVMCSLDGNVRFTVCLAAKGDGTKLTPYVVFGSAAEEEANVETDANGVVSTQNQNNCMNVTCMIGWLRRVLGVRGDKRLLVWDSYGYHVSHETIQEAVGCNVDLAIVPGGCTKYVHAPEVFWNERFKKKLKDLHGKSGQGGALHAPTQDVVVQWIVEAWDEFPVTFIADSIKQCGVTVAADGSEDDEIQCFRKCEPYEDGRDVLARSNRALHEGVKGGEGASFEVGSAICRVLGKNTSDYGEVMDDRSNDSDDGSDDLNVADCVVKTEMTDDQ